MRWTAPNLQGPARGQSGRWCNTATTRVRCAATTQQCPQMCGMTSACPPGVILLVLMAVNEPMKSTQGPPLLHSRIILGRHTLGMLLGFHDNLVYPAVGPASFLAPISWALSQRHPLCVHWKLCGTGLCSHKWDQRCQVTKATCKGDPGMPASVLSHLGCNWAVL